MDQNTPSLNLVLFFSADSQAGSSYIALVGHLIRINTVKSHKSRNSKFTALHYIQYSYMNVSYVSIMYHKEMFKSHVWLLSKLAVPLYWLLLIVWSKK